VAARTLVFRTRKQAWSRESATTALVTRRPVFPLERMPLSTHSRAGGPALVHPTYPVAEAAMTPRRRHDGRLVPRAEPLRVTNPHAAGIDVHSAIH
jgi:hypothetical protein